MDSVSVSPDGDAAPWLPLPAVLENLATVQGDRNAGLVDRVRLAAAAWVEKQRPDLLVGTDYLPTADVVEGAHLLVARLYARRSSPVGLASYGDAGVGAVARFDPDIEKLLGIGHRGTPVIG